MVAAYQNLIIYHHHHNYSCTDSYFFPASSYRNLDYNIGDDDYDPLMAGHQEESRSNTFNEEATTALVAAGSTSRNQQQQNHDHDEGWLQLSIGGNNNNYNIHEDTTTTTSSATNTTTSTRSSPSTTALVELDLLNSNTNNNMSMLRSTNTIMTQLPFMHQEGSPSFTTMLHQPRMSDLNAFLLMQQQQQQQQQQDSLNWGFSNRPFITPQFTTTPLPSSSSYNMPRPPYRIHNHAAAPNSPSTTDHIRVINPPRRINSGIWFMLQASQIQAEPYLPQISKSFLRIKDGRMTVKLLMKYLVNKLRLDSEFEVEIRCRGQEIEGNWTLQHVRDNIWSLPQREMPPLPYTVNDHLMILHYGRRSSPP